MFDDTVNELINNKPFTYRECNFMLIFLAVEISAVAFITSTFLVPLASNRPSRTPQSSSSKALITSGFFDLISDSSASTNNLVNKMDLFPYN